jgi:hypothetical protein
MSMVNRWLLRRLDKIPEPEPLPPRLEELRATVERRTARAVFCTILAAGVYTVAYRLLAHASSYLLLLMIPLVFIISVAILLSINHHSRMAVEEYANWLQQQPPVPSRVMRMGVPYERQAPVATIACSECPAGPGQRHSRSCPSVPPEWFKR